MSMIGEYARVTAGELDRARRDPAWALTLVGERMNGAATDEADPASARCLDVDKAWDAIGFLLRRKAFPVDIVHGEEELTGADDWGYGPPRYLTPARVRAAAEALEPISGVDLTAGADPADLARSEVYPTIVWERGESLDYVRAHYDALRPFFRAAADEGEGMLVWLG